MPPAPQTRAQFTAAEPHSPIFISYASADRPHVERLVKVLEAARFQCWVSYRDIGIGENYQAAISQALRSARVLIVLMSRSANASVEIPKELSLASRNRLAIMPLRVAAVQPTDALAYELATHQWIDLFEDWTSACDRLLAQLAATLRAGPVPLPAGQAAPPLRLPAAPRPGATPATPAMRAVLRAPVALKAPARPTDTDAAAARSDSVFIGFVQFAIVAAGFAAQLYNALQDGGPSLLELLFWAIFLAAAAGVVGALLRGFAAVSRSNHRTLIDPRSPAPT